MSVLKFKKEGQNGLAKWFGKMVWQNDLANRVGTANSAGTIYRSTTSVSIWLTYQ